MCLLCYQPVALAESPYPQGDILFVVYLSLPMRCRHGRVPAIAPTPPMVPTVITFDSSRWLEERCEVGSERIG